MPSIRITPRARAWLTGHGGIVTLRPSPRHGCCGGQARVPVAEARAPDCPDEFERLVVSGITVFRSLELDARGPVSLDLESLLGFKRLVVEGLAMMPAKTEINSEH